MSSSTTRTEISQLGEFGLIDRLTKDFTPFVQPSTHLGVGDDAALIDTGGTHFTVLTTDMLLEGIHFDLAYTPLKHLGYKAVAVNISDVAAMNAIPTQITVNLGLSNRFSVEALEELYAGIHQACTDYKVDLAGGDTTSSRAGLVISVTALGTVPKGQESRRSGGSPGDILCVTGDLGAAYVGLQLLEREKRLFLENPSMQPELEGAAYVVGRQLKPKARTDIVYDLLEMGIVPTAMIDISDGLASEVLHICHRSGTGAALFEDKIPVDEETAVLAGEKLGLSPITCALNGGEDYELLFTIRQADYEKIKLHANITPIGYLQEASKGVVLSTRAGEVLQIKAQGWTHF